jgi:hypothetical protein
MKELDLWPRIWDALDALTAHYGPAIDDAASDLGIPHGEWYGWLMAAHVFEPEPISASRLHVRSAYTAPRKLEAALEKGATLGLLKPCAPGEYQLTPTGRAGVQRLIDTARGVMGQLQPLPDEDLLRLAGLLQRLVEASLAAPEPPGKWCLRIERHYDPGVAAPVMHRLDQHLSDLLAYRDDSHLAAWQRHDISGQAWEAFSLVWRSPALSVTEVSEKLARRGYTEADYASALEQLAERGWIEEDTNGYWTTAAGDAIREEVEALTNQYFYRPWGRLDAGEILELTSLVDQFTKALLRAAMQT